MNNDSTDFFDQVFQVVRLIPPGRITSYGAIARYLGSARSSRMVGWAMNASHRLGDVPAHRVVNRMGMLTGKIHFHPPEEMERRLRKEGIEVKDDRILRYKELFWDPITELAL
jgi:methylated-DNA-protein-cysteine methyltransferase-like protein